MIIKLSGNYWCLLFAIVVTSSAFGQNSFSLVGDAYGIPNVGGIACGEVDTCFTLTENVGNQSGAVWDDSPIDLSKSFNALFCLTLGTNDQSGADGFAFVMRG